MEESPAEDADEPSPDPSPGSILASSELAEGAMTTAETDDENEEQVNVGVLVATSPEVDTGRVASFARQMVQDATAELHSTTDVAWRFIAEEPTRLTDNAPRRPSQFLDESMDRLVEGPYDIVVVVTNVSLLSRTRRFVPGLASPVSRVVVVSTRRLVSGSRDEPVRSLDSPAVRWNGATLLLHLIGHVLGARHRPSAGGGPAGESVMEPFDFDPSRRDTPTFDADVASYLQKIGGEISDESSSRGRVRRAGFHLVSALRNLGEVANALRHSRAFLFPLSLPKLATTAITPTLVIVFSAESWDVGFHMSNTTAALFAVVSILAAAVHLMFVQNLFFPRRRRQVITEHMALVNVIVFCILVAAMASLFALVGSLMLIIEFVVFPPQLMENWPSLENPAVSVVDRIRTAVFISTIGMLSGALAGGLENRDVLRHLALFRKDP